MSDRDADVQPLSFLVEREAKRVLSEAQLSPDPARLAEGWERRFIANGERAREMMALYEALGFEVCADSIRATDLSDDCRDCQLVIENDFKTLYTRKRNRGDE